MQILAVVVRYKMSLGDSQTMQSLARIFATRPHLLERVGVLLWDNSPAALDHSTAPFPVIYRHSPENLGVSGAYNRAMAIAEAEGCRWLILLDQDTTLPEHYLSRMLQLTDELESRDDIAAIAPFLTDKDCNISPRRLMFNRIRQIRSPFEGVHPGRVYAANSGTVIRVSALREIGGFNEDFWLDLSDVVAFHLLYERGRLLYIAGDLRVPHCCNHDGSMSPQRYMNFIAAEGAYWDLYRRPSERLVQNGRLLLRVARQFLGYRDKTYSRITLLHFLRRLFSTKKSRLHQWKQQSQLRDLPAVSFGKVVI